MLEDKGLNTIPHFDGLHYDHWSELMENFLRAKDLWSMIEIGFQQPTHDTLLTYPQRALLDESKTNDHKVKYYMYQAIEKVIFEQILDKRTSKIVSNSMKSKYVGNAKVKKALFSTLQRDFEVLDMKKGETITEYFTRVTSVVNQMRSNGEIMEDSKIVEKIMRTLTEKFTYVVIAIEESKDIDSITINELQSSLVFHEHKFKRLEKEEDD